MNPVLLKPQSEVGAQLVVQGRVYGRATAAEYQLIKAELMPFVLDSFARLKDEADIVLVEGAGSASEINLRGNDIANMGFARAADVPVVLIGDIDRGGVIASLVGTKAVIEEDDATLIQGFLVNKFRGDPKLFASGMELIAAATGWQPLGLIPFFPEARLLPAEDALALNAERPAKKDAQRQDRRSGPAAYRQFRRSRSARGGALGRGRAGQAGHGAAGRRGASHSARVEGDHRRSRRVPRRRIRHRPGGASSPRRHGARTLRWLSDARPRPSRSGRHRGRGRLGRWPWPARRRDDAFGDKRLERVDGATADGAPFAGYEMHMGTTEGPDRARPFAKLGDGTAEGAMSLDGRVAGTYIHGLFADDRQRSVWLKRLGAGEAAVAYDGLVEETLDALAAHLAAHVDIDKLLTLAR